MKVTKTDPNRLAKIYAWRKTEKGRAYVKKWSDIATQKRKEKQAYFPLSLLSQAEMSCYRSAGSGRGRGERPRLESRAASASSQALRLG